MSLHPRRTVGGVHVATALWLTLVWCLLWGTFSVGTALAGLGVGLVVVLLLPMPRIEFRGRIHPWLLAVLVGRFVVDLVVASAQVARAALTPGSRPRSAVIGVQLRSHSDLYLTLTSTITALVPGSVVVEAHRLTGMVYVHVLDVGMSGGVEGARRHVLETEARVLRALGSDEELAEAGLTRRPERSRTTAEVGS